MFRWTYYWMALAGIAFLVAPSVAEDIYELNYDGFTVWADCERRGPVLFEYWVKKDTGKYPRKQNFALDKEFNEECQQFKASAYSSQYDRGHLVPANHLDHTKTGIAQSNYMTNILPQAKGMNRGAWLRTEEIIECYRDDYDLHVVGGVVWGRNKKDDHFVKSHGVETPDYFWKIVEANDGDYLIWYVPNDQKAKRNKVDEYLVSFAELVELIGLSETDLEEQFDIKLKIPKNQYKTKPEHSWEYGPECSKRTG